MVGNGNMADTNTYVIKFEEKGLPIEKIGGKARNLGKMSSAVLIFLQHSLFQ